MEKKHTEKLKTKENIMAESVSKLVNSARQKDAYTDNGCVTNSTSLNNIVDLYFVLGATRTMSEQAIISMLERAWVEDKLLTIKSIFHGGNIRGGKGERRFFSIAIQWLLKKDKKIFYKLVDLVPEFSRWDSLFYIHTPEVYDFIGENMNNGLLAKWLPRKNQYKGFGRKLRNYLGLTAKQYRKAIVSFSKTIEQQMCSKKWVDINYSQIPSVAFNKYRKAWYRNDEARFKAFVEVAKTAVKKDGIKLIKAKDIFPYDIFRSYERGADVESIDAQWMCLPDYMADAKERILPICDVSDSMKNNDGLPMAMSVSLGVYISERNKSIFKDAFITFSGNPKMMYLQGSVTERFRQLKSVGFISNNTDLDAVFRLILDKAIDSNLTKDDMPTMLLIISDMEFDGHGKLSAYDNLKMRYKSAGYEIPKVVFWNVNGRSGNVPVNSKCKDVALVSGGDTSTLKSILKGAEEFTPVSIMMNALDDKMYDVIEDRLK